MFNRNKTQCKLPDTVDTRVYREPTEIVRVLLIGNSEVVIYRDQPGHLVFGLFNPISRKPEN